MFVLVMLNYLFVWETYFKRSQAPIEQQEPRSEKIVGPVEDMSCDKTDNPVGQMHSPESRSSSTTPRDLSPASTEISYTKEETIELATETEAKHSFASQLRLWRGRITDRNFIKAFLRPFPLMIFPSVLFSTIVNGAMLTWVVISGIISAQVLLYPPYNLQPDTLSYLSLPMSAAALVSSLVSGIASDWQIKYMARKNGGVYEPEFRLLLLIPAVIISTAGFLILGPLYNRHAPVYQIVLANTLFSIAMPFGSAACTTYILDTMQNSASEAFVATALFKSLYMFLATFYVPGWFAANGAIFTYRALAILNVCFGVAGIPMYMLGKRWRAVTSRSALLRRAAGHDVS